MLYLRRLDWLEMLATARAKDPLEACGVLIGAPGGDVVDRFVPIANEARSSKIFRLDGAEFAKAVFDADNDGLDVVGVFHSHPRSAAYPSAADVAGATAPLVPPSWHWAIASLAGDAPELRSYVIGQDGRIDEEPVKLVV